MNRRTFAALAAAIAMIAPSASVAQSRALLRVGADVDAGALDPRLMRDTTAFRVTDLIFDGLVTIGHDLSVRPGLAEKWETPNPTTYVFHLRQGVQFHNGQPFTAEDVVHTISSILDPKTNAPFRGLIQPIKSVEAVNSNIVRITLSQPYSPLLSYLDFGILPRPAAAGNSDPAARPIGTGPMKLARWDRGSQIVLAANDDYWGAKSKVREMRVVIIGDNTARAQALEAGNLDFIQSPLSPQDVLRLKSNSKFGNLIGSGLGVTYLNFNAGDATLADPRMRRALAHLVDRRTIVEQIYKSVDTVASSILMPSSWSFAPSVKQPDYDMTAAEKLFAELGWRKTGGKLMKDGKQLAITLSTHSEDPNRVQTIEFLQAQFAAAGIETKVAISDWPSFSGGVREGKHQIALLGWLNIVDPDRLMYNQLHSTGGLNWGKYRNPTVDSALDEGRGALDVPKRAEAYRKAADVIANEVPYLILSYQGYQAFFAKSLGTLTLNPRGYLRHLLQVNS
jgi:peptide/nickel transport system substrate-binding protein